MAALASQLPLPLTAVPSPVEYAPGRIVELPDRRALDFDASELAADLAWRPGLSVSDEDHDPTPVPTGCPGCWKRAIGGRGARCASCPDRAVPR